MDFKEYSAAFHSQNDDIMHYGVKGMKWDPSKKKKTTSKEEDTASEQRKNVAETAGLAGRSVGLAIAKGIYDNVPKRKNIIDASSFKKSTTLASRKAPTGIQTASGSGLRLRGTMPSRGKYADSNPDEQVSSTKKKKKKRGRMPRGRYSERG